MKKMTSSGMSLVEILIVTVISGGLLFFIGAGIKNATQGKESFLTKSNVKATMIGLMESIIQAGRLAHSCTYDSGPPSQLACNVDTNNPPTPTNAADDTRFEYEYHKASALCQGKANDNCVILTRTTNGNSRTTIYNLGPTPQDNSENFIVCNDATIWANTCPLGPTTGTNTIWARHKANVDPTATHVAGSDSVAFAGRYFRIAIAAIDPDFPDGRPFRLQTAFFRRNPIPGFTADLRYQWGSKE